MPVNLKKGTSAQEGKKRKKDFFKTLFDPVDADVDNEVDLFLSHTSTKLDKKRTPVLCICGTFVQPCWKDLCTAEKWVVGSKFQKTVVSESK